MTDKELYKLCCECGAKARKWTKKFAELLPKVYKRKLWKKHGFYSVEHFAAELAGMNHETTKKILGLHRRLEDKPKLKAEIVNEGWAKVRVAAAIPVSEEKQVQLVKTLPKRALQQYAKTAKQEGAGSLSEPVRLSFTVKPEVELRLRKFRQKLEKERKESIGLGEALEELLKLTEEPEKKTQKSKGTTGRNPSAQKKRETNNNGQCSFPGCNKPHTCYHHPDRYAATQNHDRIVALCHEHHQLAHAGYIENEHDPPEKWRLRETPKLNAIDLKYQEHMKRAQAP